VIQDGWRDKCSAVADCGVIIAVLAVLGALFLCSFVMFFCLLILGHELLVTRD
jgi:hypothetical protein